MRIEITRSGGFGGLTRTWSLEVSASEAEQRWLPLAAEAEPGPAPAPAPAPGEEPTARSGSGAHRDRFTYRITIGYTEVLVPEEHLEEPWRELIDRARAAPVPGLPAPSPGDSGPGTDSKQQASDGPGAGGQEDPRKLL